MSFVFLLSVSQRFSGLEHMLNPGLRLFRGDELHEMAALQVEKPLLVHEATAFDLTAAYTRARFTDDDPAGNRIPGAPDSVASAGVTVDNIDGWFGSLRWRYFGPKPLVEDDLVRSDSSSFVTARLAYRLPRGVQVGFEAFNLFDQKGNDVDYYYESRLPGEPPPRQTAPNETLPLVGS